MLWKSEKRKREKKKEQEEKKKGAREKKKDKKRGLLAVSSKLTYKTWVQNSNDKRNLLRVDKDSLSPETNKQIWSASIILVWHFYRKPSNLVLKLPCNISGLGWCCSCLGTKIPVACPKWQPLISPKPKRTYSLNLQKLRYILPRSPTWHVKCKTMGIRDGSEGKREPKMFVGCWFRRNPFKGELE